jgi:hypothetical protein
MDKIINDSRLTPAGRFRLNAQVFGNFPIQLTQITPLPFSSYRPLAKPPQNLTVPNRLRLIRLRG